MMARAGPEIESFPQNGEPVILGKSEDFDSSSVLPSKPPASRSKTAPKPRTVASRKKTAAPRGKSRKKPFAPSGFFWRAHGPGFDLKRRVVASHNGVEKRRELYVAHLGKAELAEMRKRHKGKAFEDAIQQWVESHQ
jgi:hypothetical protein